MNLLWRGQEAGHPVLVVEKNGLRSLEFASGVAQSSADPQAPERLCLEYTRHMMLALAWTPEPQRVLLLGLGAGSLACFLHHHFPACTIEAVERSALVLDMARRFFSLPPPPAVRVELRDAAEFVRQQPAPGPYELICVDLFEPEAMSAPVFDEAFHAACLGLLAADGVLCINLWSGDARRHHLALEAIATGCGCPPMLLPVSRRSNVIAFVPAPSAVLSLHELSLHCRRLAPVLALPLGSYLTALTPSAKGKFGGWDRLLSWFH